MPTNPTGFTVDAILCDSAVTADGKLYVQGGGWNMLGTSTFPFHQPRIGLGVVIGIPYTATNRNHTLTIHLENEDGARVSLSSASEEGEAEPATTTVQAQFNIGRPPTLQSGDAQTLPFALNVDQLRFESPGSYSVVIEIDSEEIERLTFRILSTVGTLGIQRSA